MLEQYYFYILFTSAVLLLILGGFLCLGSMPSDVELKPYGRSKLILGVSFVVWAVHFYLHWKYDFRTHAPHLATAINLTMYYYGAISFTMAFVSLLKPSYISRQQIVRDFSAFFLSVGVTWCAVLCFSGSLYVCYSMLTAAALLFFAETVRFAFTFFRVYREVEEDVYSYYYDNVATFVRWMYRSVVYVVVVGLLGASMLFAPKWVITLYAAASIPMFLYVFFSMQNYLIHYKLIRQAVGEQDDTVTTKEVPPTPVEGRGEEEWSVQRIEELEQRLDDWVARNGHLQQRITIASMAAELQTNRTYMSAFFKNKYNCTFREWINLRRIEQAKLWMIEFPDYTIEQIAGMVGYVSRSHFVRIFSDIVGQNPSEWRKLNH